MKSSDSIKYATLFRLMKKKTIDLNKKVGELRLNFLIFNKCYPSKNSGKDREFRKKMMLNYNNYFNNDGIVRGILKELHEEQSSVPWYSDYSATQLSAKRGKTSNIAIKTVILEKTKSKNANI